MLYIDPAEEMWPCVLLQLAQQPQRQHAEHLLPIFCYSHTLDLIKKLFAFIVISFHQLYITHNIRVYIFSFNRRKVFSLFSRRIWAIFAIYNNNKFRKSVQNTQPYYDMIVCCLVCEQAVAQSNEYSQFHTYIFHLETIIHMFTHKEKCQ